ncbi:copper chaperone PCu(A)C [Rhodobacter sp. Har01]|uniref:copper chaperone PCu(A)C n=1 Tax=Rhodobacter sp. Har01 TaxID=2883999 RepID=UPI001D07A507|nr:copper chaperone PCu(A)C [Rhodobacter sp. Har01]MCB6178252.1 copper chaperone PCu(A)C [Rhodobacter sp. Har01]
MLSRRTFLAAAAAILSLSPGFAEDASIHVMDAYGRTMGGIGASGAAFFTLHNMGATDDRLVAAKADVAQKVELHTHIMDDQGVMKMVEVKEGFPVAAGGMHELKRGADHVMLMGLTTELKDGDSFPLTLVFESGTEVTVEVPIDNARMPAKGEMDHGTGG